MQKNRISRTVTRRIVLGDDRYATTVTVTPTGMVTPDIPGADAIIGRQSDDEVINRGSIAAVAGNDGLTGGVGIDLAEGGMIINRGSIAGGASILMSVPLMGGNGVDLRGGTLINSGAVVGGALDPLTLIPSGSGGTGVRGFGAKVTIDNTGSITGGTGFANVAGGSTTGGLGIDLSAGGTITNAGTIAGGATGAGSGIAVQMAPDAALLNHGLVIGGNGTSSAVLAVNDRISNFATIQGVNGYNGELAAGGALGVQISGGSLSNSGVIEGGTGGIRSFPVEAYDPGNGVDANAAAIVNRGVIEGGAGFGRDGGTGINLSGAADLTNIGTIGGGMGFYATFVGGGAGGTGIDLAAGAHASNRGLILAGSGAGYGAPVLIAGGGGTGVILGAECSLANSGTIAGGAGGNGEANAVSGGDAVDIDGGTLTSSGTIIAGAVGAQGGMPGTPGDAVRFLSGGTLIVDPGAIFEGDIGGSAGTLMLAGLAAGTLAGFGSTITGIGRIDENAGAHWTLEGTIAGSGPIHLGPGASLTLEGGPVSIPAIIFAGNGHDTLTLGAPGSVSSTFSNFGTGDRIDLQSLLGTALSYAAGTLSVLGANDATLATLIFAGNYTQADFALQADGGNTDILFAGGLADLAPEELDPHPARGGAPDIAAPFASIAWHAHGDALPQPWLPHR